ncbi:MAG: amidase family protein [Cyclobacteriaceae bacterium]
MGSEIQKIHKLLTSRKVSCTELIQERLDGLEKNTHATVNFLLTDFALERAQKVDAKLNKGEKIGLLEGVPFGIKDVFLLQGQPASASSDFLKAYKSPYTATAIQRLLDEGAIPIVKENCDSFGHGSTSENTVFGSVKNALDDSLVGGGSSGGSAVNVALQHTAFSIGGDTGGSIRQPAGYNKVYGLKPTYGKISRYGIMAYASSTDCVGPIANSVEDVELLLNVMAGEDVHDQTTFTSETVDASVALEPKKVTIGYYKEFVEGDGLNATIKADFFTLLDQLKAEGVSIKELSFAQSDALVSTYYVSVLAETASNLARLDGTMYGNRLEADTLKDSYSLTRSENFTEETKKRIVGGNQVLSEGHADEIYTKATAIRSQITACFTKDLEGVSVILSPVSPSLPPKIGEGLKDPLAMYLSDIYTIGFSLAGLPTLAIPAGTETGIQITGDKREEELLLRFATLVNSLSK